MEHLSGRLKPCKYILEGGQCIFGSRWFLLKSSTKAAKLIATCCYFLRGELVLGAFQVTTGAIASYARG